jgi:acyl-CoA synthetase (AMP-forming)/AMP-acid ligase II
VKEKSSWSLGVAYQAISAVAPPRAVAEAAVIAVEHAKWMERPLACVVDIELPNDFAVTDQRFEQWVAVFRALALRFYLKLHLRWRREAGFLSPCAECDLRSFVQRISQRSEIFGDGASVEYLLVFEQDCFYHTNSELY